MQHSALVNVKHSDIPNDLLLKSEIAFIFLWSIRNETESQSTTFDIRQCISPADGSNESKACTCLQFKSESECFYCHVRFHRHGIYCGGKCTICKFFSVKKGLVRYKHVV